MTLHEPGHGCCTPGGSDNGYGMITSRGKAEETRTKPCSSSTATRVSQETEEIRGKKSAPAALQHECHRKPKKLGQTRAPATLQHECHRKPKKLGQSRAPAALQHECHRKPKKLGQNGAPATLQLEFHRKPKKTRTEPGSSNTARRVSHETEKKNSDKAVLQQHCNMNVTENRD